MKRVFEDVSGGLLILGATCLFLFMVWTSVVFFGEFISGSTASHVPSSTEKAPYCFSLFSIHVSIQAELPVWLTAPLSFARTPCRNPVCGS